MTGMSWTKMFFAAAFKPYHVSRHKSLGGAGFASLLLLKDPTLPSLSAGGREQSLHVLVHYPSACRSLRSPRGQGTRRAVCSDSREGEGDGPRILPSFLSPAPFSPHRRRAFWRLILPLAPLPRPAAFNFSLQCEAEEGAD